MQGISKWYSSKATLYIFQKGFATTTSPACQATTLEVITHITFSKKYRKIELRWYLDNVKSVCTEAVSLVHIIRKPLSASSKNRDEQQTRLPPSLTKTDSRTVWWHATQRPCTSVTRIWTRLRSRITRLHIVRSQWQIDRGAVPWQKKKKSHQKEFVSINHPGASLTDQWFRVGGHCKPQFHKLPTQEGMTETCSSKRLSAHSHILQANRRLSPYSIITNLHINPDYCVWKYGTLTSWVKAGEYNSSYWGF